MAKPFVIAAEATADTLDWGRITSLIRPANTGAKDLAIVHAHFFVGKGHDFHRHPRQEEVIYVLSGKIEQWVDRQKHLLGPGDAAFIPADTVHASFTVGEEEASILAVFGPAVGDGFTVVDMAGEAPWSTIRG
ncbi:MAG: cupin domain-containing protein [Geminicoccaceae bacterium]